ncbi:MAG: hypothetical protein GY854_04445 [Deltaproteobacteria bacterium]|nr:hypothetical protein [Deltaproteobacteria bacterium]
MMQKNRAIGPGPERLTNAWVNGLGGEILNTWNVVKSFPSGVVWGCEPTVVPKGTSGDWIQIAKGGVIANGMYYEIAAAEFQIDSLISQVDECIWVYVGVSNPPLASDNVGLRAMSQSPPFHWPDRNIPQVGLDEVLYDSPVIAIYNGRGQEQLVDVRHFVRTKPNNATLVVGDLNAGADFESIQQALDYLMVSDLDTSNGTRSRRILVTKNQILTEPLRVGCHGVSIEGVRNEVGPPVDDDPEQRVILTWAYDKVDPADDPDATDAEQAGALIDVQTNESITLKNLHFVRTGGEVDCCIHDPGNGFQLEGCIFGEPSADYSFMIYAVHFQQDKTENVRINHNEAYKLSKGLLSYELIHALVRVVHDGFATGCLTSSVVEHNYVSTTIGTGEPEGPCDWLCPDIDVVWDDPEAYYYAIDMGVNAHGELGSWNNTVQHNVIEGCFCGIRVGQVSKAHANAIRGCVLFGVMATGNGLLDPPEDQQGHADWLLGLNEHYGWLNLQGDTEVLGNHIEMAWFGGVPWWRAGVRLELPHCHVRDNNIVLGTSDGCGIVQGPLNLDKMDLLKRHMAYLYPGDNIISDNTIVMRPLLLNGEIDPAGDITRRGIGISLNSVMNRVEGNGVYYARVGLWLTAFNLASGNVISPSVVPIFAWASNTLTGNTIGWAPHMQGGLPWTMEVPCPTGGIMLSWGNVLESNAIVCTASPPGADLVPAAVHVNDWPGKLFGHEEWRTYFDTDVWQDFQLSSTGMYAHLQGKYAGNNVISNQMIELSARTLPEYEKLDSDNVIAEVVNLLLSVVEFLISPETYHNVDGIVLNGASASQTEGEVYAPLTPWFTPLMPGQMPVGYAWEANILNGCTVWRGLCGIRVLTGKVIVSSSAAWLSRDVGLDIVAGPDSSVADCTFVTIGNLGGEHSRGLPVSIGELSRDTMLNDCLISQLGLNVLDITAKMDGIADFSDLGIFCADSGPDAMHHSVCVDQQADRVTINDCTIINFGNAGIYWKGSHGTCSGCWFYTRSDILNPPEAANYIYYSLILALAAATSVETDIIMGKLTRAEIIAAGILMVAGLWALVGRYPAIYFAHRGQELPCNDATANLGIYLNATTGGNLVTGAHVANSQVWVAEGMDLPGIGTLTPFMWANCRSAGLHAYAEIFIGDTTSEPDPLYPPVLDIFRPPPTRWSNRVNWPSCYIAPEPTLSLLWLIYCDLIHTAIELFLNIVTTQ